MKAEPLSSGITPSTGDVQAAEQDCSFVGDIVTVTGELGSEDLYRRIVASVPRDIIETALAETRAAVAADGIENAGAYFIASLKISAAVSSSRYNYALTPIRLSEIDCIIAQLQQAVHAIRQARAVMREMYDNVLSAMRDMDAALQRVHPVKTERSSNEHASE